MRIPTVATKLGTGEALELRSPAPGEAPAVLSYIRELSREASRNLNHPPAFFDAMTEAAEAAFLESCAAPPKSFFIAAFHGDRVVGTASITTSGATFSAHCAELGIGVLEPYRRRGVGRILMTALIENAEAVGVWNLTLRVRTFNQPAIALYESLGFVRVGTLCRVAQLPEGFADEHVYQRAGR